MSSRRLTSAWKLLVSWVIACHRGLAEMRRGYVAESLGVQDQPSQIDRYLPCGSGLNRLSGAVAHASPPPLDGLLDLRAVAIFRPGSRKRCGGAFRAAALRQLRKAYPHRHRHTFANGNRLAVAQRRQEVHQAMRGLRDGAPHDVLILMAGHTEGEHRVTLRQQTRRQIRRTLTDDAQRNAVFAALLGDTKQRPLCRLEAKLLVAWCVTVCLFANYRDRDRRLAPQGKVEGEPAQNGNHYIQYFRWDAGEVENSNRLTIDRYSEEL